MRLNKYINELFDTDLPVRILSQSSDSFIAKFTVGDEEYTFDADLDTNDGEWYITFMAGGREDITGTGNAAQVFSGIIKLMKMFIKSYSPHTLAFHAKEKSRIKLYDRFAKMIKGYKLTKAKESMGMRYVFKKPKRKVKKKVAKEKTWGSYESGLSRL
jgi:hypothetical protein